MKNIKTIAILLIFVSLCMSIVDAATTTPFIIRNDKKKLLVKSLTADEEGVLTYKTQGFSQKLKPRQYSYARIPIPTAIKSAVLKYRAKKYRDAVKEFDTAFKTNRYLGWGSYCMYYAAKSLEARDKNTDALARLKLLKHMPIDKEEMPWYFKAKKLESEILILEEQFDEASKILSIISKGNDTASAMFANNAKGDILLAQKKNSEALFIYMRNVLLFNPSKSKDSVKAITEVVKILKEQKNPRTAEFEKLQ